MPKIKIIQSHLFDNPSSLFIKSAQINEIKKILAQCQIKNKKKIKKELKKF